MTETMQTKTLFLKSLLHPIDTTSLFNTHSTTTWSIQTGHNSHRFSIQTNQAKTTSNPHYGRQARNVNNHEKHIFPCLSAKMFTSHNFCSTQFHLHYQNGNNILPFYPLKPIRHHFLYTMDQILLMDQSKPIRHSLWNKIFPRLSVKTSQASFLHKDNPPCIMMLQCTDDHSHSPSRVDSFRPSPVRTVPAAIIIWPSPLSAVQLHRQDARCSGLTKQSLMVSPRLLGEKKSKMVSKGR